MSTAPAPVSPTETQRMVQKAQVRLIDLRPIAAFLRGHIPGSLNVPYVPPDFAALAARLLPPGPPAILIADGDALAAAVDLQDLGHAVAGRLAGGLQAWVDAGLPTQAMEEIAPEALRDRLSRGGPRVIDVRGPEEWAEGVIAGAVKIPLATLPERLGELDPAAEHVTVCAHGRRSQQAAWLLLQRGFGRVASLSGGMAAWKEAGLPTV